MRKQLPTTANSTTTGTIAYVLKGYPRLSETFIASEIYRLEQQGVALRLFVIKPADETVSQPIVERIQAQPQYLPDAGSVSETSFLRWLVTYGRAFLPALRRVAAASPTGMLRAAAFAFAQAVRARRSFWAWPRKVYAKEFLQAVALADGLLSAPDVRHLHAHFCHGATTVTWMAAMITGLSFSFTAHAKDIYSESLNPVGLLRRKLLAARFAVTCTEANRLHLQKVAPEANVYRIYHGVNADFTRLVVQAMSEVPSIADNNHIWHSLRTHDDGFLLPQGEGQDEGRKMVDSGLDPLTLILSLRERKSFCPTSQPKPSKIVAEQSLRLLTVGRLVKKKGFDIFIEACGLLRQQGVAFSAVIAGENGEHGEVVRRRVKELGLTSHITFLGPLRQDQLFLEYQRASLFCLPCRVLDDGDRDGIPNVLMEAMACGVPVVTTTISGIPELITDSVNGVLIPPEDPAALAAAILRLHRDPQLVTRLATTAQATIREHFDGDLLANQLAVLFQQTTTDVTMADSACPTFGLPLSSHGEGPGVRSIHRAGCARHRHA